MLIYVAIATGLIAVYMLIVTLRPLVDRAVVTADDWQRLEDESLEILLHRDRIIEELRDLEFEAAMDKVEERDLETLRRRYESEALRLMGEIETQVGAYDARIDADVKTVIERARARRAQRAAKKVVADVVVTQAPSIDEAEAVQAPVPKADEGVASTGSPDLGEGGTVLESTSEAAEPVERCSETEPETAAEAKMETKAKTEAEPGEQIAVRVPFDWIRELPCEQCATVVSVGSAFCDGCGASVVRACESCGHDNRLQAQFCRACGESVAEGGAA